MHKSNMSCVSSITTDATSSFDDHDGSDDDTEELPQRVPPPPPHIELLNLGSLSGGRGGKYCISHVISYLDDDGRESAAASSVYLREAVNEWYGALLREVPWATGVRGSCVPREPIAPLADEAESQAPMVVESQEEPMTATVAAPVAVPLGMAADTSSAKRHLEEEQRQKEAAEQRLEKAKEEAERRLEASRLAAAAERQALEARLERERIERERELAEKRRAERDARLRLAADMEARQAKLESLEREEQLKRHRRSSKDQKQLEGQERARCLLAIEVATRKAETKIVEREERLERHKQSLEHQEQQKAQERARHQLASSVAARKVELETIEREQQMDCQRCREQSPQDGEEERVHEMARDGAVATEPVGKERPEEERMAAEAAAAKMQAELGRMKKERLVEKERLERLERERKTAESKLLEHIEREKQLERQRRLLKEEQRLRQEVEEELIRQRRELEKIERGERLEQQRRLLEEQKRRDEEEDRARRKAREEAAAATTHLAKQKRLEEIRLEKEMLTEKERLTEKEKLKQKERDRAAADEMAAAARAELLVAKKRNILEEMDELEDAIPRRSPPRFSKATKLSSLDEKKEIVIVPRQGGAPTPLLALSSTSLDDEESMDQEDEIESLSTIDMKAQSDKFLARISLSGVRTPLSFVASDSVASFHPEDEKRHDSGPSEHEDEDEMEDATGDELSVLPAMSRSGVRTPSPVTPLNPTFDTPSPASLTGATRLVMGSKSHLGDGSRLPILGRVQQIEKSKHGASRAMLVSDAAKAISRSCNRASNDSFDLTENMQQSPVVARSVTSAGRWESRNDDKNVGVKSPVSQQFMPSMREQQPQPNVSPPLPKFTRVLDMQDATTKEEIPFDEMPFISGSMSTASSLHQVTCDSPQSSIDRSQTWEVSNSSLGRIEVVPPRLAEDNSCRGVDKVGDEARDVLTQFSDAALFGETPKVFSNTPSIVTNFMADIVGSAKDAMSNLYHNNGPRRNRIDDDGPIKIGDKYYSHNEALQLWRKAKVKLVEDWCETTDNEVGDNVEQVLFLKKSNVIEEGRKKKQASKSGEDCEPKEGHAEKGKGGEGPVSINELLTKYNVFEQRSRSIDESTILAGNVVKDDEEKEKRNKFSLLPVVIESKEEKTTRSEATHSSHEVTDTESEIKSLDGSDDTEMDTYVNRSTDITSGASCGESDSIGSDSKNDAVDLKKSIQLTRTRAGSSQATTPPWTSRNNVPTPIKTNNGNVYNKQETDSVAGNDSIPSHMGSMYGVEVTSLRGMSCNFINGKSSEQIKIGGEKSVGKDCEQSVLGSQYGTEVVFKVKKVATARKPRTLASHNMGVKAAKHTSPGAKGVAVKQANMGAKMTMKQPNVGTKSTNVKQSNIDRKGTAGKSNIVNKVTSSSKQQRVATNSSPRTTPARTTASRVKSQKKPNHPLKKLKLGIKKAARS